jgi:hypothetical protein
MLLLGPVMPPRRIWSRNIFARPYIKKIASMVGAEMPALRIAAGRLVVRSADQPDCEAGLTITEDSGRQISFGRASSSTQ